VSRAPSPPRTSAADRLYAAWADVVLILVGPLTWVLVHLVPGVDRRWRLVRRAILTMQLLGGLRIEVKGTRPEGRCVVVANHSSYIDGAVLISASPTPLEIAVGAVLRDQRIAGPFLERIGCVFLGDRKEPVRAQLRRLAEAAARGRLAAFPEERLVGASGLDHFGLGAFVAAVRAGVPVCPLAIIGSAEVLPPGSHSARHHRIVVRYGELVSADGEGFPAARRLSERARAEIAAMIRAEHR
jgi:1-acyl-sn-glycerol-3-phosphate acyltransferase